MLMREIIGACRWDYTECTDTFCEPNAEIWHVKATEFGNSLYVYQHMQLPAMPHYRLLRMTEQISGTKTHRLLRFC
jgi:hypothetical protein